MALPTAQLGSLPTMNMPYSVPTYEKGPSIWEKALASFLVNAASGVASQGAENVMSRDYADEFGKAPAKGFGRLLGPVVGEDEAKQLRRDEFYTREKGLDRTHDMELEEFRGELGGARDEAAARNAMLRDDDRLQADLDAREIEALNAQLRDDRKGTQEQELVRLRAQLEGQDPGRKAQAERDLAAARQDNASAAMYERFSTRGQGTPQASSSQSPVSSNVAAFAKGSQPPAETLPDMSAYAGTAAQPGRSLDLSYFQRPARSSQPMPPAASALSAPASTAAGDIPPDLAIMALEELIAQGTGAGASPGQPEVNGLAALQELLRRGTKGAMWNHQPTGNYDLR